MQPTGRLALVQKMEEHLLIQLPWPVLVGIGQRRSLRGIADAKMLQLPQAGSEATANLPERVGLAELAKEHGDKLIPAGESLGGPFSLGVAYCLQEIALVKDL